uniref:DNA cytosine methyltransferase n=1 Tax=uncultured Clostridium sp. TaxID=59620 RepID=UPI00272F48F4
VIQTFPRTLEFTGDLISKYKQIGNAVPVKLAEAVAKEVYKTLQECKIEDEEYIQQSLIID